MLKPKEKIHCNRCRHETNHVLKGSYDSTSRDDEIGLVEIEECGLYQCAGCEAPTLLVRYSNNSMNEDDEDEISVYPERRGSHREPEVFVKLPAQLKQVYAETVSAFNTRNLLLCTLGLRTVLEGVCDDKKAKGDHLREKIDGLGKFFPTGNIAKSLHGFRFSGNDAAHDLVPLRREEAAHAIDVMEDLLNYLYDLDYEASRMKNADREADEPTGKPVATA